jgi:two-component system response regulator FixJ
MVESRIVYIVDDDLTVSHSMAFFLSKSGFETRSYSNGRDLITDSATLQAGCILLDIRMPDFDGFDVLAALGDRIAVTPVIVMTGHGDVATAVRAMKLGASDFLEKPCEENLMLATFARVFATLDDDSHQGTLRDEARAMIERLTRREQDVLRGLIAGRPNKTLAFELGLSVRTVEMHRARMMDRLGVRTLSDALRIAFRAGTATENGLSRGHRDPYDGAWTQDHAHD